MVILSKGAGAKRALLRRGGTPGETRTHYLTLRSLENSISQGASQCHVMLKSTVKSRELNNPSILEFLVRTPRITSKNLRS